MKKIILLILGLTIVIGACADKTDNKQQKTMTNVFSAYVQAINTSDLDAAMALIASDAELVNSKYRPKTPKIGIELIKEYIGETVIAQNGRINVLSLKEVGDTIEANIALKSDRITQAGCQRILGTERFTIQKGKIKSFEFLMNLDDKETKVFFDFVRNLEANRPK